MTEGADTRRSAVVFGARNLGRAVIELLVAEGWAVAGVARSEATLAGVTAAGALALQGDVTDQASVREVLETAAAAHGERPARRQCRRCLRRRPQRPVRRRPDRGGRTRCLRLLGRGARSLGLHVPLGGERVPPRARDSGNGHSSDRRLVAPRRSRVVACGPPARSACGRSRKPRRSSSAARASTSPC